jgi:non-specific protein-tyrosine kinase
MELYRYLKVLRKHLGVIVLLTFLGGGAALGFSLRQHKIYKATATLVINAASPTALIPYLATSLSNNNGVTPLQQLANTYSIFLQSRAFDQVVIKKLHLHTTPDVLSKHISSELVPNTNYFTVDVTWGDPAKAAALANGIARIFIRENAAAQASTQSSGPATELQQSLTYFRREIARLQKQRDALLSRDYVDPAQVTKLNDTLNSLQTSYYQLLGTAGANQVTQGGANAAALSDLAVPPSAPISPRVAQNTVFGVLAGLVLGLLLALLLDYLDYSVHTPEELEELVGYAPLGIVSKVDALAASKQGRRKDPAPPPPATVDALAPEHNGHGAGAGAAELWDGTLRVLSTVSPQLTCLTQPKSPISEAFRALRTNLEYRALDKPLKSLVVTSSLPEEGKSTVAANLAIAMAQAGKRVILVDTDLRRPSLAKLFSLDAARGFTTVLLNREDRGRALDEALQPTMVPRLRVLASGPLPPNPAELLASESMIGLLRDLEARADLVIFDSPPLGPLTDAVVLSARVSGTLLVVRASSTRRTLVTNSINQVHKVNGTVLGTVLNMVHVKGMSSYSYYYYYQAQYDGQDRAEARPAARWPRKTPAPDAHAPALSHDGPGRNGKENGRPIAQELLGVSQAAEELGLAPVSIRNAITRGTLGVVHMDGRTSLVPRSELERYRQEHLRKRGQSAKTTAPAEAKE